MNTAVTSKETILLRCRELVSENGLSALHMRTVAQKCHVALGSLYNYFPSKNALTIATIESVWQDIFHMDHPCEKKLSFPDHVHWIFRRVTTGMMQYPNFFTAHSISFASDDKEPARQQMGQYFLHMKHELLETLKQDQQVRSDAFDDTLTPTQFVDFTLSNLLTLLVQRESSCTILLTVIRRTLY